MNLDWKHRNKLSLLIKEMLFQYFRLLLLSMLIEYLFYFTAHSFLNLEIMKKLNYLLNNLELVNDRFQIVLV